MFLGLIVMILLIIIDLALHKNVFSPVTMFVGIFTVIICLASQKEYNMWSFDNRAIMFIEIGSILFALGTLFMRLLLLNIRRKNTKSISIQFNWQFIYLMTVVVTIVNFILFFFAIVFLVNGGNYIQLRNGLLGYGDTSVSPISPLVAGFSSYIASPGLYALLPVSIWMFVQQKHVKFTVVIFLDAILNIVSSGSRIILIYIIVQFAVAIVFNKENVSYRVKYIGSVLIIVAFVGAIILSVLRSSSSIFHSFYAYFSAPVALLSYWTNYVDQFNIHSYGLSFLYPFTWIINAASGILGLKISIFQNVVMWQSLPQDVWVGVFPGQSMNAFSTLFYFFYEDFRQLGICFFSFIFGSISEFVYYQSFVRRREKYLILYLLGVKALIGSFMIWQLGSTSFFLSLILLLMCMKGEFPEENSL